MRVQVISDIHFEHHHDEGVEYIQKEMQPEGVDVLILAGDIAEAAGGLLERSLRRICRRYSNSQVLFVPGNHEFYTHQHAHLKNFARREYARKHAYRTVKKALEKVQSTHSNFVGSADPWKQKVGGKTFIGCTGWYKIRSYEQFYNWSDCAYIYGAPYWINDVNLEEQQFLRESVEPGSVVITHFLPSYLSVHPKYAGMDNDFFVNDMEHLMCALQPAVWVHGHTHDAVDTKYENTRIVCNPVGYPSEGKYPRQLFLEL